MENLRDFRKKERRRIDRREKPRNGNKRGRSKEMDRVRLVVFPIKGRNWAFSIRSIDASQSSSHIPSTLKDLWKTISSPQHSALDKSQSNVELVVDFFANKVPPSTPVFPTLPL